MLREPEKLSVSGAIERVAEGLRLSGRGMALLRDGTSPRDGAVRMRAVFGGAPAELRHRKTRTDGSYQLVVDEPQ